MRNSSLVERACAENITGLKIVTEAMGVKSGSLVVCSGSFPAILGSWGAALSGLADYRTDSVGERSRGREAVPEGAVERLEVRMLA